MTWYQILPLKKLQREKVFVHKRPVPERSIALFWSEDQIFAMENFCPHQGYPLDDGYLDLRSGTLTCNRHMWSFELGNGRCTKAGAQLKVFNTKVEDSFIWVEW